MLSAREVDILEYCLTKAGRVSIKDLSASFNVSERSIRYYMKSISSSIKKANIEIEKGICIIHELDYLKCYLHSFVPSYLSPEIKRNYILFYFVLEGGINLTQISNHLMISRTSTKSYFDEAKVAVLNFNLSVEERFDQIDNKGYQVFGSEDNMRKLLLHVLLDFYQQPNSIRSVLQEIVDKYIEEIDLHAIDLYIHLIQEKLDSILSDQSYLIVRCYLIIMIKRNKKGYQVETSSNDTFLGESSEYSLIKENASLLNDIAQTEISQEELMSLTNLLIGSHYFNDNQYVINNTGVSNLWFEHNLLASKIISLFSKHFKINLTQDNLFHHSLLNHLKPTMYRLLHDIKLTGIDHIQISHKFPNEFNITKKVLNELNFFTNKIDEDEIALLTLHVKAALNRFYSLNPVRINILVVCSHGYGTSKLLEQQLLDSFEVTIQDCIPHHYLSSYKFFDQIDLIVTTVPITSNDICNRTIPFINVHPILSDEDTSILSEYCLVRRHQKILLSVVLNEIKRCCTIHNEKNLIKSLNTALGNNLINDLSTHKRSLLHFLSLSNVKIVDNIKSWKQAIALSGELLVRNGYVDSSYSKTMMKSFENYGSYMVIDDGIAIPHAKNEGNVKKTGITLLVLRRPVMMDEKALSVFFSFCSHDNSEHLDALVAISNLVRETDFKARINNFEKEEDILDFIYEYVSKQE